MACMSSDHPSKLMFLSQFDQARHVPHLGRQVGNVVLVERQPGEAGQPADLRGDRGELVLE